MTIDWFTVGAQIINFLVLVWLLKRFLYQPVLTAIATREQRIAASIADAATSKAQAAQERAALQAKSEAFDKDRAALLAKATADAAAEGKRLSEVARKSADALKDKQRKALASDAKTLSAEISRRTEAAVFDIARKALADLADEKLEERIAALFITKLVALKGAAKTTVSKMLMARTEPAVIRSAFELPTRQHAAIQKAVNTAFGADIALEFETVPDLVAGIELVAGGQKLAWSISDYLKTLEKNVETLMQPASHPSKDAA